jgi:hypothetical protein
VKTYPQATVKLGYDGGTVYGWNAEGVTCIRIVGQINAALRPAMEFVADCLDRDRNGLQWARAMLDRLPEVQEQAQAFKKERRT